MKNISLKQLLGNSLVQHQGLHDKLTALAGQLPILDMESTVQAVDYLNNIFQKIKATDQQIFSLLDENTVREYHELVTGRMAIGGIVTEQYRAIIPKLQTRLAGYRTELLTIQHGLHTMSGYADSSRTAGSIINTAN